MTKRINKADRLIFSALQKAIAAEKIHLCLINSKINIPSSPVYNPWEGLVPLLSPVLLGLILIWAVGIACGITVMTVGIFAASHLARKKLENRLLERAKNKFVSDYQSCCDMWQFGGLVLVKADDKKIGCLAPEGDWKEFVVRYFSDLMTSRPEEAKVVPIEASADEKAA
ncbi:MAG: hypothetical protein IJ184_04575 [Alphaproteobacteria bacterium]|nr:hypothetical protein [Alphaproteobacteria bacterium]